MKTMLCLGLLALATTPALAQSGSDTNAFARTPPANTKAFGTEHGGKVTAFGNGGTTTNAFGNKSTATHNARRLAHSFGTGTDHHAAPIGPSQGAGH